MEVSIMKSTSSQLRAKARAALGGQIFANNWLLALVAYLIFSLIYGVASSFAVGGLILYGPLMAGLSLVFLKLIRTGEPIKLEDSFEGFKDFVQNLLLGLMYYIFLFLWTLLFVIPGIVKTYSYSMCFYIKNDHPEYTWNQCITESRKMMKGYKWKLFCLDFSFIGWIIVGALACGIGTLWVYPYQQAAHAAFYEELKASLEPVVEAQPVEEPTQENA